MSEQFCSKCGKPNLAHTGAMGDMCSPCRMQATFSADMRGGITNTQTRAATVKCVFCGDTQSFMVGNFDEGPACIRCCESKHRRSYYKLKSQAATDSATIAAQSAELADLRKRWQEVCDFVFEVHGSDIKHAFGPLTFDRHEKLILAEMLDLPDSSTCHKEQVAAARREQSATAKGE